MGLSQPLCPLLCPFAPCSDTLWQEYSLTKFIPFNPTDKYTIAYVKDNKTGAIERVMKGAPQASRTPGTRG